MERQARQFYRQPENGSSEVVSSWILRMRGPALQIEFSLHRNSLFEIQLSTTCLAVINDAEKKGTKSEKTSFRQVDYHPLGYSYGFSKTVQKTNCENPHVLC